VLLCMDRGSRRESHCVPSTPPGSDLPEPFVPEDELRHPVDFQLLQNGPVSAYADATALTRDIAALEQRRYRIERFACERWTEEQDLHDEFARRFSFPSYYGRNMNALAECMADTDVLHVPGHGGLCVVLDRLDRWPDRHDRWPDRQEVLLQVLSSAAWYWLLFGRRLITLVLVGDRSWRSPRDLGATTADWRI
jgi:Barstar (barnase inhibitor)